ncbi:proton-coupled amino acid transporter-like protein pathetic isoform X1 [Bicyclus anynana]|uniref:Proton-coupled amino acid transporter-like protein pathetic isoform X1 n=2 Tax=Bicyclus anynana TaxID=110368 RepID=A0A6J1NMH1_BICAN|nr:proton-coupled amino acid transporter-like protein pathetic isoform X1 [Bicyclus anynana]
MDINKKELDDYNPFEHRKVKKPNSDIRSLANLLKASLGSGILAIPLAFANAGWGVGIVGTVIIAFICGHCVHIFVNVSRMCCKAVRKPLLTYAETCEVAFAIGPKRLRPLSKAAGIFAEFSLIFTYVGVCCIFTVLIADSIKQLLDRYVPGYILPVEYYCLILLVPLCLIVQIRYLKWLAPISLTANIMLVATFAICVYYIFKDDITISDKLVVGYPARFPAFLSTVIFAMEGIGVVMPVENDMKRPEHFLGCPGVMVVAMTFIMLLYCILGLFGYFRYGDALRGSITLNLPMDDWPAICAKAFIAISIFCTYPLHFYVVVDVLSKYLRSYIKKQHMNMAQIFMRIAIVWLCGGIGIALPMLEQIINIVGALFYSILGLIIPGIVETVCRWKDLGKLNWILWKNILLVLFGFCCLISGMTVTISDIITNLDQETE